jgi:ABC-type multidrug transport system ATPase subunit
MLSNLTVRETVRVSAELKLPVGMPAAVKQSRVDSLLSILGLQKVANQVRG